MLTLSSLVRVLSISHPGVTFVIRQRTERQRINLRLVMQTVQGQLEEVMADLKNLGGLPHADVEELTDEQRIAQQAWMEKSQPLLARYSTIMDDEIHPSWVEWGLARVEGLVVEDEDGNEQKITGKNALTLLPRELFNECVQAIKDSCQLGPDRGQVLESPTTSSAAVDGQTPDMTAPSANSAEPTSGATALNTSPIK